MRERVEALKSRSPGDCRTVQEAEVLLAQFKQVHRDALVLRDKSLERSMTKYRSGSPIREFIYKFDVEAATREGNVERLEQLTGPFEEADNQAHRDAAALLRETEKLDSLADLWCVSPAEIQRRLQVEGELSLTERGCLLREILRRKAVWRVRLEWDRRRVVRVAVEVEEHPDHEEKVAQ